MLSGRSYCAEHGNKGGQILVSALGGYGGHSLGRGCDGFLGAFGGG